MLILTLRSDKPIAEIGLYDGQTKLGYLVWEAGRQLSDTINCQIVDILMANNKHLHDLEGLLVFQGPGSFTGLRIGHSVANALAYALKLPIVSEGGESWLQAGLGRLLKKANDQVALPEYGAAPHITPPRK